MVLKDRFALESDRFILDGPATDFPCTYCVV